MTCQILQYWKSYSDLEKYYGISTIELECSMNDNTVLYLIPVRYADQLLLDISSHTLTAVRRTETSCICDLPELNLIAGRLCCSMY